MMDFKFEMDGMEHIVGDKKCCGQWARKCDCGGIVHYQPVWGGYYYECDLCHEKS